MVVAEVRDLTVHIDTGRWSETVLDSVDLDVPAGQVTALLGESGCGKSMLAASLTGRLPATATSTGHVRIDGDIVRDHRHWRELRGRTVGLVPQDGITAFSSSDTVGAQLRAVERRHRRWTIDRAYTAAAYPTDTLDLYPNQHSSGQVQRAAIAAALLPEPGLLIADEPTASLDVGTGLEVWSALRAYADAGAAVLVITQEVPLFATTGIADRMVFMRGGRVVATGSPSEFRSHGDAYIQGFFHDVGQ